MFSIVEIDKSTIYLGAFVAIHPYVYKSIVTVDTGREVEAIASYWTSDFEASGTFNAVAKNIQSVTIDYVFTVPKVASLADCKTDQNSFYFDIDEQVLYIHTPHDKTIFGGVVASGIVYGFCSDTVRYFKDQIYQPIVQSIPNISDSADPLQYGIMAFGGGTITLVNDVEANVGLFDTDEKLYGNDVRIKRGDDGDAYEDLVLLFSGYVKDYTTTTSLLTLDVADNRERLQVDYPTAVFSGLTTLCEESNGKIIPDGYGDVIQVPAFPTAINATDVTFQWGTAVTSITQLYAIRDDVAIEIGHGDWYLPSKDELNLLYTQLHVNGLGSFGATRDYWSSTAVDASNSWRQYFGNGGQVSTANTTSCYARPVRAFTSTTTYTVGQPSPSGGFIFYASVPNFKECGPYDVGTSAWATAITNAEAYDTIISESTDGTFNIINSIAYIDGDNTKGLKKVFVSGRMRAFDNPADIIKDLNTNVLGIEYSASNYDTTEWEAESASLSDIALYMGESKPLYQWIEQMQAGSNYGFRYEDKELITMRLDNPDRGFVTFDDGTDTIAAIDIRNSDIPIKKNATLYASSCIVKYSQNHRLDTFAQVVNTTYETAVVQEHRVKKIQTIESLLTNSTDADERAARVMADISEVRPIVTLVIDSDKYANPRIYDMIKATVSLLTNAGTRTYYGALMAQIIGIDPIPDTDEFALTVRQREVAS